MLVPGTEAINNRTAVSDALQDLDETEGITPLPGSCDTQAVRDGLLLQELYLEDDEPTCTGAACGWKDHAAVLAAQSDGWRTLCHLVQDQGHTDARDASEEAQEQAQESIQLLEYAHKLLRKLLKKQTQIEKMQHEIERLKGKVERNSGEDAAALLRRVSRMGAGLAVSIKRGRPTISVAEEASLNVLIHVPAGFAVDRA